METVVPTLVTRFRTVRFVIKSDDWMADGDTLKVCDTALCGSAVAFGSEPGGGVWVIFGYIQHLIEGQPQADPFMHILNLWQELGWVANITDYKPGEEDE